MTLFWIMGAIMVALALAFVLPAMLRAPAATERTSDTQSLNAALFRERIEELEKDLADGLIEQARFDNAREDLERELLHELESGDPKQQTVAMSGRWMIGVLAVLVPLVTVSLYLNLGEARLAGLDHRASADAPRGAPNQVAAQADQEHSVNDMVQQLVNRLQQEPNDATGWTMLGRSYMVLERFPDAVQAFAKARELMGDIDPDMLASYAEAIGLANGGQLAGEPVQLIRTALRLDPENGRALWLMGHYSLQTGDNQAAAQHWRKLLASMPAGSQQAQVVSEYLAQIGDTGVIPTAETPAADAHKAIEVSVSLDPSLASRTKPEDTVFVFARAAQGPRMPLAIIRGQVKDLPMTVTLDDSLAMSPTMTLSSAAQVVVGARVSQSGNATPQPGDLEGLSGSVQPGATDTVRLTINQVVQ